MNSAKDFKIKLESIYKDVSNSVKNAAVAISEAYDKENSDIDISGGFIEIPRSIIHQHIDDQMNETISSISIDGGFIKIDTGSDVYVIKLQELNLDELIEILSQLEELELEDVEIN
jgi:hypothetical protein